MFCESCGAQNNENSQFCESCGASLGYSASAAGTSIESPTSQGPSPEGKTYARIAVIFGVLGIILFFFFFFGLIAVILGYFGFKKGDEKTGKIAMILGAVGILMLLLASVFWGSLV